MARKFEGSKIQNSGRRLRIDITPLDIKKGKVLDPANCAAAQSIMRSTEATEVRVHRGVCYLRTKTDKAWVRYKTSSALRMETIIFDRGGTFMPGEYDLDPVPLSMIVRKPANHSRGRKPREVKYARRRQTIPGVRRSARATAETEE